MLIRRLNPIYRLNQTATATEVLSPPQARECAGVRTASWATWTPLRYGGARAGPVAISV